MPFSPGSAGGFPSSVPKDLLQFRSDREIGIFLRDHDAKQIHATNIAYQKGDFIKVLGLEGVRNVDQCLRVILDAVSVEYVDVEGYSHQDVCIGSFHIGNRFLRGAISIVSNSGYWRGREVAPRSHPNDGKLDIVELSAAMKWAQRRMAWKKALTGSHLPHPLIQYSQGEFFQWSGKNRRLVIDGKFVSQVQKVSCRVQSDCLELFVL